MDFVFRTQRRVEFRDTDAAGIVNFSVFFTYMEQAEHELLLSRGLHVMTHDDAGSVSWPRVAARCDYQSSARFEDLLDIEVTISRLGKKSITYEFHFSVGGRAVASGEVTAVCCRIGAGSELKSIPIPPDFTARLQGAAPPD